jgi:parallel beta-helix repeat protein
VTLTGNVITSHDPQLPTEQFGVVVARNAKAQIIGNTVTGAVCDLDGCGADPILEFQSAGILPGPDIPGTTVSDNHVSGADIGIYPVFGTPNCCTISGNVLTDNRFFGIAIQDGDGSTRDNTITGGQVGIGVIADAVDTTGVLRGDHISGTTVAPVQEIECCGYIATAIVKN